jgi:hypothetical protein
MPEFLRLRTAHLNFPARWILRRHGKTEHLVEEGIAGPTALVGIVRFIRTTTVNGQKYKRGHYGKFDEATVAQLKAQGYAQDPKR